MASIGHFAQSYITNLYDKEKKKKKPTWNLGGDCPPTWNLRGDASPRPPRFRRLWSRTDISKISEFEDL